jgi:hypothetical protein
LADKKGHTFIGMAAISACLRSKKNDFLKKKRKKRGETRRAIKMTIAGL